MAKTQSYSPGRSGGHGYYLCIYLSETTVWLCQDNRSDRLAFNIKHNSTVWFQEKEKIHVKASICAPARPAHVESYYILNGEICSAERMVMKTSLNVSKAKTKESRFMLKARPQPCLCPCLSYVHKLWLNNLTETFLLVSCSNTIQNLLWFVHGEG